MHGDTTSTGEDELDNALLQLPSGPLPLPKPRPSPPALRSNGYHSRLTMKNQTPLADVLPLVNLTIRPANFATLTLLHQHLHALNLTSADRLRPSWDNYFMTLAELASLRSNCMKRRVGAVLVSSSRKTVLSTGYNGTPRGMTNCAEGGCARCNSASKASALIGGAGSKAMSRQGSAEPVRSGMEMEECLCLHAEENALLEAGRERASGVGVDGGAILYCNTYVRAGRSNED